MKIDSASHTLLAILVVLILASPFMAQVMAQETTANSEATEETLEEEVDPKEKYGIYKDIQFETIYVTLMGFEKYYEVKTIQDGMYSIPGVKDFIPILETRELQTFDLKYPGKIYTLMLAIEEVFEDRYEKDLKEIGIQAFELTLRPLGTTPVAQEDPY
jgi:hypothetical protein